MTEPNYVSECCGEDVITKHGNYHMIATWGYETAATYCICSKCGNACKVKEVRDDGT